jgi:hypothetical protein
VSVTVAPLPIEAGMRRPLRVTGCAVKFTAETFAPLTVTGRLAGVKVNPALLGVTYEPFKSVLNE